MNVGTMIGFIYCTVLLVIGVVIGNASASFEDKLFDGAADTIKEGIKAATGAEICDAAHVFHGIPFCPPPDHQEANICCYDLAGNPGCCNFLTANLKWILIGGGIGVFLLLVACCCCCYCCCCKRKSTQGVTIVHQFNPAHPTHTYPNHPHHILLEDHA